jgi:hypothetical protein
VNKFLFWFKKGANVESELNIYFKGTTNTGFHSIFLYKKRKDEFEKNKITKAFEMFLSDIKKAQNGWWFTLILILFLEFFLTIFSKAITCLLITPVLQQMNLSLISLKDQMEAMSCFCLQ